MKIEYEDTFVKVAGLIGGPDYVRVARALLNNENATDEEIASATGLKIKTVRKSLYDLFGRSLISGVRVRDPKRGWFVYRWKAQRDQTDGFIQTQKKKILTRLKQRNLIITTSIGNRRLTESALNADGCDRHSRKKGSGLSG